MFALSKYNKGTTAGVIARFPLLYVGIGDGEHTTLSYLFVK